MMSILTSLPLPRLSDKEIQWKPKCI
uniref:Uncharacterized protein n=1 Tax=Arundo donax TaxID=35708 RepID=A0A0A9FHC2_ARUDO